MDSKTVIKTKIDALKVFRESIVPRIRTKYIGQSAAVLELKRRRGWTALIQALRDKNLISQTTFQRWQLASSHTSEAFRGGVVKLLKVPSDEGYDEANPCRFDSSDDS